MAHGDCFPNKKSKITNESDDLQSFTPRDYQVEILEAAKQNNTIACLGTGTGKTFIAVMLIRENANEVRKPFDEGGKRIFFLVPTVPLVTQQSKTIRDHTDLTVSGYYGERGVDSWNKEVWISEFQKNEVLVMTGEIFRIILNHAFIPPRQIKLLIIDECHRTQGDHPYRSAMKCFLNLPADEIPRIFGLTASLLNGKCKPTALERNLRDLEKNLRSTIVTASDLRDIQKYGTDPTEYIVLHYGYNGEYEDVLRIIIQQINEIKIKKTNVKRHADFPDDVMFFDKPLKCMNALFSILKNLGPWCTCKAADIYAEEVKTLLYRKADTFDEDYLKTLEDVHNFLLEIKEKCRDLDRNSNGTDLDVMPHKLKRLAGILLAAKQNTAEILKNIPVVQDISFEQDPMKYFHICKQKKDLNEAVNLCTIIFVEQRVTAYALYQWLLEIKEKYDELSFLKPEFVVGHGNTTSSETSMSEKIQQKKLKNFRDKQTNVLVATQVLEEGMDIRQCNLVIRFDLPVDFRSYVQSKGRARAKDSNYVLLIEERDMYEKFMDDLVNFKTIEKMLQSKCHDRSMPKEEEISTHMADSEMPPYMPRGPDGPRITMSSAISIINRYCASLPTDMTTKLVPQWSIRVVDPDNIKKEYECTLRMPINSSLRQTIVSAPMRRKKLAKMCAALKACQILDEKGEMNENLVPISCLVDNALQEELGDVEEEDGQGAIPGTNRRRQVYEKCTPIFLKGAVAEPGVSCFLNIIKMALVEPLPNSLNPRKRPLIDPARTPKDLALLCKVKLPSVNPFPVFTKCGKILVTVIACDVPVILTEQNIKDIEEFHNFIFSETLYFKSLKEFLPRIAPNSYYICPVIEAKIDWDFIFETKQHPYQRQKLKTKATVERTPFSLEKFSDAVLMRSYKIDTWETEGPSFHHVVRICHDLTPNSPFEENSKFKTFQQYFFLKYNVLIYDMEQPLVETVQLGGLHMWKPLYISPTGTFDDKAVKSKTKQRHQNYREYLVPELCIIHPFPSTFFFKVMCLPTILFRLNGLLLAEEIRQAVALEAGIGTSKLTFNKTWEPFHLETSNKALNKYLNQIGELKEMPQNEIVPRDIIKDACNNEITSFEVKIDLKTHSGPSPSLILQALTAKGAGDEFDLERLEIIGDSFLKYSMSVKTYTKYPDFDEGKLTRIRIGLIQNLYLYQKAKKKKLPEYLITTTFNCNKTWLPPCYVVEDHIDERNVIKKPQKKKNEENMEVDTQPENALHLYFTKQVISDKCVADSVEALIGCYLLSSGQLGALKFMAWVGLNPFLDDQTDFENWPPPPPNPIVCEPIPLVYRKLELLTNGFDRFEKIIGYTFKNKAYLLQAFTHPSYINNDITDCYQRLEFLGDSVLDYLITRQLFEDPAVHSPGKLTDLRSALVNNIYFASLAVFYKYHEFLKILSPELFRLINNFIEVLRKSEAFKFFEIHHYLEEIECFEVEEIDIPKALGDVFESVAGAIYLDSGMSLDTVWKVCYPMIRPAMKHFNEHVPLSPVRELYELVKCTKIFQKPIITDNQTYIEIILPDGRKWHGVGPNKKVAKRSAAKRALADLKRNPKSGNF